MILALNPREEVPKGFMALNVTSRSKDWGKNLSPFFLGPVINHMGEAQNVENAWQFTKVYKDQTRKSAMGKVYPNADWFEWLDRGYADTYAHRYPKGKGNIPEFSYYYGKKLGYVEARKTIYIPMYLQGLRQSDWYIKFIELVSSDRNIAFIDFDVFNHYAAGLTLEGIKNDSTKKYGHGFVLIEEALRIQNLTKNKI